MDSESLWVGRSRNRIPVGKKFSVPFRPARKPIQPTVQEKQGFLGLRQPQHGADYPPPSSTGLRLVRAIPPPPLCACISVSLVDLYLYNGFVWTYLYCQYRTQLCDVGTAALRWDYRLLYNINLGNGNFAGLY